MAIVYDETPLRERAATALANDFKHEAIKDAQEAFFRSRAKVVDSMPGFEQMRNVAFEMRNAVTKNLDYYVKEFATHAEEKGILMHYAKDAAEAMWEVLDIFEKHGANKAVKSKSMMSEEIGMNEILEEVGVEILETDCAETILQTARDKPSHIVVPALHLNRDAIAKVFADKRGYEGDNVPEHITHFLRGIMREEFLQTQVGVRGCNVAVASTGGITLVTNEGNGRMVDTVPPVQIVLIGVDRLVRNMEDLDCIAALLARSAVGSEMTAYFTLDTGMIKPGEIDGPREVHYVMIDNGRSAMIGGHYQAMLHCIRCGACLNICPVYRHITGHGYGSIYPGPMGIVLTAALEGYEKVDTLANACSLCGACTERCPVKIPLHTLIRQHRIDRIDAGYGNRSERLMMNGASAMWQNLSGYKICMKGARFGMKMIAGKKTGRLDAGSAWLPVIGGWTSSRDIDIVAPDRFRTWFEQHKKAQANAASKDLEEKGGVNQ